MAKNYMADVAKILGVELGEDFKITEDNLVCRLTEDGLKYKSEDNNWYYDNDVFVNLLDGTVEIIKLPWQPKKGDRYCYPIDDFRSVNSIIWNNHVADFAFKEAGFVFKTYEECKAALPALRKKYLGDD